VRTGPAAVALQVFNMGNFVGVAHEIPEILVVRQVMDRMSDELSVAT
jgi:hypothetical protein